MFADVVSGGEVGRRDSWGEDGLVFSKYMCIFALVIMRTEGDAAASCVVWLCLRMFMTMIYDL